METRIMRFTAGIGIHGSVAPALSPAVMAFGLLDYYSSFPIASSQETSLSAAKKEGCEITHILNKNSGVVGVTLAPRFVRFQLLRILLRLIWMIRQSQTQNWLAPRARSRHKAPEVNKESRTSLRLRPALQFAATIPVCVGRHSRLIASGDDFCAAQRTARLSPSLILAGC